LRQLARSFVISTTAESSMNKKLVTLAVAAAIAAPTAAMAEAVLYGKLHVSIDYQNVDNAIGTSYTSIGDSGVMLTPEAEQALAGFGGDVIVLDGAGNPLVDKTGAQDFSGWGINGRSSRGYLQGAPRSNRVGVKGSEDLGNGLKAVYQVEFGVQLADTNGNVASGGDNVTMRNSFVGLAGDWGTFLVGRHDTPLKISTGKLDLFGDTMADYNGTVGFDDIRADNVVAYISPSFSGLSFAGAIVAPGGTNLTTVRPGDNARAQNINADSLAEAYSLALIYKNGPWYASAAYESISNEMYMTTAISNAGKCDAGKLDCDYVSDDYTKWRLGLGILDWNGFTLTAIYEDQDNRADGQKTQALAIMDANGNISVGGSPQGVKEQKLWQVQAGYSFGNNMIKAMYGALDRGDTRAFDATRGALSINNVTDDLAGDKSTWAIAFDHNFSKRTKAYVLYTNVDDDNDDNLFGQSADWSGFSVGMIHKF
jgi:predicted porin